MFVTRNFTNLTSLVWGTLHSLLDLPERLLGFAETQPYDVLQSKGKSRTQNCEQKNPYKHMNNLNVSAVEWLRSGGSSKSSRFMSTLIDVLRFLACEKFICFCIDDLQFAVSNIRELGRVLAKSCRIMKAWNLFATSFPGGFLCYLLRLIGAKRKFPRTYSIF